MSKVQQGMRVDRLVHSKFVGLCRLEKLRPGEAVEALMRTEVEAGGLKQAVLLLNDPEVRQRRFLELEFRSCLNRLEMSLEADEKVVKETGGKRLVGDSYGLMTRLYHLAPKVRDEKLLGEFERLVEMSDRTYSLELEADVKTGNRSAHG